MRIKCHFIYYAKFVPVAYNHISLAVVQDGSMTSKYLPVKETTSNFSTYTFIEPLMGFLSCSAFAFV